MNQKDEMLEEYNFSNGIRGKYAQAYKEGVKIVKLDTDVMKFFSNAKSVGVTMSHDKIKLEYNYIFSL